MSQFRIDYVIMRRRDGDDDFAEIGFGSSGAWSDIEQCAYMVESAVQNREWETGPGMPDPSDAGRAVLDTHGGFRDEHHPPERSSDV